MSPSLPVPMAAREVLERVPMRAAIDAVEEAYAALGRGAIAAPFSAGTAVPDGTFHVKACAAAPGYAPLFVAKVNSNFPANRSCDGLPTIQGVVAVFETTEWTEVRRVETGTGGMLPVTTSPDGALVAIGWEHHLGLWRADEDEPAIVLDGLPKGVYTLDFSPDGRLLAQGGADGRVRIYRVRGG